MTVCAATHSGGSAELAREKAEIRRGLQLTIHKKNGCDSVLTGMSEISDTAWLMLAALASASTTVRQSRRRWQSLAGRRGERRGGYGTGNRLAYEKSAQSPARHP